MDVVVDFFWLKGVGDFIVEIGGEVYVFGKYLWGGFWVVGVEELVDNKIGFNGLVKGIVLENCGIVMFGDYWRYVVENGVKYVYYIDFWIGCLMWNNLFSVLVVFW